MTIITTITIFGGIGPFVIGSITLRGQEPLARGWDEISRHTNDSWLPIGSKDMPANQTSGFDGYHVIDRTEMSEFALDWWFLEIIQRWSRRHGATRVEANGELGVTAALDIAGGSVGGRMSRSQ